MQSFRSKPSTWFKVYVALALASLCIACMSIWLGSTLLTAHRDSVHLHAEWASHQDNLAELALQAGRAYRAVSGQLDTESGPEAVETFRRALVEFDLVVAECLEDLRAVSDKRLSQQLADGVRQAESAMHDMATHGEGLIEAMESGDHRVVSMRLARFNTAFAEIQSVLAQLRPVIRDSIIGSFRAQLRESERLERRQYTVAGLMCIGVVVAVWYGRRLYEATTVAEHEHEQYLEAMSERREAAEAANRAKSEFLANMSHEIRTPMTSMLGYADLLSDAGQSDVERDRCIRTIRRSGEHLLAILNDILDLSKIEAGRMTLERLECSPIQIVEEVFSLLHPRAVEQGITLQTDYQFPLPRTVSGDPLRIKQILLNLVGNAIKFTTEGSVTIRATYQGDASPRLDFTIVDTGIGMSQNQIAALFQPFTQGDGSTTRRFGGSGLGLSISRRLAEMMGATIGVESCVGEGSTFTLRLSLEPGAEPELVTSLEEAAPRPAPAPAAMIRLDGQVLLAEDGPDNQRLIMAFLTRAGAHVHLVENGRDAVDRALSPGARFDLILLDMQMPELDGYTSARFLRARGYRGPIVALTAHATASERERCIAAGCDDHISKPIDRQRFLECCQNWIERGRSAAAA